jgi:hypothetical protein
VGEITYGIAIGWLSLRLRRWTRDPRVEITLSLMTPYVAFLVPAQLGGSVALYQSSEILTRRARACCAHTSLRNLAISKTWMPWTPGPWTSPAITTEVVSESAGVAAGLFVSWNGPLLIPAGNALALQEAERAREKTRR